jgi:hypothetical protein
MRPKPKKRQHMLVRATGLLGLGDEVVGIGHMTASSPDRQQGVFNQGRLGDVALPPQ